MRLKRQFIHAGHRFMDVMMPYRHALSFWWKSLGIRFKLSVLFAGLILVMSAFFYAFATFLTTREIKIAAIYKGEAIAEAIKNEIAYSILSRNFSNTNNTFRRLTASRQDIAYLFLVDNRGYVLAHDQFDRIGQQLTDPLTLKDLAATTTQVDFIQLDQEGHGLAEDLCDLGVPIYIHGKRTAVLRIGISFTQYLLSNGPRIRRKLLLFTLPFAFLSILIALKLAESFAKPLKTITEAAKKLSEGEFEIVLPLDRRDEFGEVSLAFQTMAQQLKQNFEKVSDMANRDGLTGLFNNRFFQDAFSRELERAARTDQPLSLIMFDVDRFKRINDRYGHPVGDSVLQNVSRTARSTLRGYDLLARYGGEEFVAMLPGVRLSQASLLAERLRQTIEQRPVTTENGDVIRATVSIGVAEAHAPYSAQQTITEADQALYKAKESGRNCVMISDPEKTLTS